MTLRESILWCDERRNSRVHCATVPLQMVEKPRRDFSTLDEASEREERPVGRIPCLLPNESRFAGRHSSSTLRGRALKKTQRGIFIATAGRRGSNLLALIERRLGRIGSRANSVNRRIVRYQEAVEIFIVELSRDDIAATIPGSSHAT